MRLGEVHLHRGELAGAGRFLADAMAMNARSVEAPWLAARAARLAGDDSRAAELLARAAAAARATGAGSSASNEGDTRTGAALVDASGSAEPWWELARRARAEPDWIPDPAEELGRGGP